MRSARGDEPVLLSLPLRAFLCRLVLPSPSPASREAKPRQRGTEEEERGGFGRRMRGFLHYEVSLLTHLLDVVNANARPGFSMTGVSEYASSQIINIHG